MSRHFCTQLARSFLCALFVLFTSFAHATDTPESTTLAKLQQMVQVGDIVFLHVSPRPFREISQVTQSWVNHVGIVVATGGSADAPEALIAESTFPRSKITPLSVFVARSVNGQVAVKRMNTPLSAEQLSAIEHASQARLGIFYDTGFDLHSRKQFCSRFVHEVVLEATGITLGEVQSFRTLFVQNPHAHIGFWRAWFLGSIPWQRETITPASVYRSPELHTVFDGRVR